MSDEKKIIYIHIPKTGGTSLTHILNEFIENDNKPGTIVPYGPGWQEQFHLGGNQHSTIEENIKILGNRYNEYFKFCFIRNPYTWLYSMWKNVHSNAHGTFSQWLKRVLLKRFNGDYWPTRLESGYIFNKNGKCLCDYLAKFENYEDEIVIIAKRLNIPISTFPHNLDRNGKSEVITNITTEDIKIINEKYLEEFDLLGYEMVKNKDEFHSVYNDPNI